MFGFGTAQIENYDPIDPLAIVLPRQTRLEHDMINLTEIVNLISQQLIVLCEARGVTIPPVDVAEQPNPSPNEVQILMPQLTLLHLHLPTATSREFRSNTNERVDYLLLVFCL